MFRSNPAPCQSHHRFPRARGDVPTLLARNRFQQRFSPRTRGCSFDTDQLAPIIKVFPAHAGMFLPPLNTRGQKCRFPRARGDVPKSRVIRINRRSFSPRTRGCSFAVVGAVSFHLVFPAHAGMFLAPLNACCQKCCFPRARGDVPYWIDHQAYIDLFSPRTRGCSDAGQHHNFTLSVFPAHAGMFRSAGLPGCGNTRFPRARGDVPCKYVNVFLWFVVVVRVLVPGLGW